MVSGTDLRSRESLRLNAVACLGKITANGIADRRPNSRERHSRMVQNPTYKKKEFIDKPGVFIWISDQIPGSAG
jgi:hypothetical protein